MYQGYLEKGKEFFDKHANAAAQGLKEAAAFCLGRYTTYLDILLEAAVAYPEAGHCAAKLIEYKRFYESLSGNSKQAA